MEALPELSALAFNNAQRVEVLDTLTSDGTQMREQIVAELKAMEAKIDALLAEETP